MRLSRDARSAAIGGLAAVFVVSVSLAPKLLDGPDEVTVRSASDTTEEAGSDETTTTTQAPTTTTTHAPTTTTAPLEERVTKVEDRVTVIEQTTTTTTTAPPTAPTTVFLREEHREEGWTIIFAAFNHPQFAEYFPNPRIRFTITGSEGLEEHTVAVPFTPDGRSVEIPFLVHGATAPVFDGVVAMEWDGGSLPTGSGNLTR